MDRPSLVTEVDDPPQQSDHPAPAASGALRRNLKGVEHRQVFSVVTVINQGDGSAVRQRQSGNAHMLSVATPGFEAINTLRHADAQQIGGNQRRHRVERAALTGHRWPVTQGLVAQGEGDVASVCLRGKRPDTYVCRGVETVADDAGAVAGNALRHNVIPGHIAV